MTTAVAMPTSTTVPTAVKPNNTPSATPSALLSDQAQDIPIFLRKTYHMIDTCDPTIACWSDDGETFVVKDPIKFETTIIPQFFKHSKFTSFVRQLNFYAFRKIKYVDTIRIDPKLEAETANYWRFRHEKFQRGKPELLGEIKRMNGQKQQQKSREKETTSANNLSEKENTALKSEVSSLKQRIEAMTKNIDELTSMVQKVTLVAQQPPQQQQEQEAVNSNNKRTKVEEAKPLSPILPDKAVSSVPAQTSATPMDMEVYPMPPSIPSPMRVNERTATTSSELSDEGFVDQLFTAFKTEDFDFDESESLPPVERETNHPRPELMGRLSDALSVLPRDIQEMIVERLIQAITSPKEIQDSIATVNTLKETTIAVPRGGGKALPSAVPQLPRTQAEQPQQVPQMGLNLAAATLAALLQQFGDAKTPEAVAAAAGKETHKSLLIPVHA